MAIIIKNLYLVNVDRKSTRLNSSHVAISYAVFCLKNNKAQDQETAAYAYELVLRLASIAFKNLAPSEHKYTRETASPSPAKSFFFKMSRRPPTSPLSPYAALSR